MHVRLFLLLALLPLAAAGGETDSAPQPTLLRLNAESAVQAALARNFSIEVERFQPRIARERVTSELGRFDPVFDLSVRREETAQREVFDTGVRLPVRRVSRLDNFSAGLSGRTPLGLSYDLGLGARNDLGTFNRFGDDIASTASLSLRQPLLRGAGPTVNLAQVRIARNNVLVSEWALKRRVIDIITETSFVYNQLHLAHEALRVAERSRELARQLLTDNQARVQIGVMSPLDVAEARAEVAAREEGVILAQREILDNENLLKQLVTRDLERLLRVRVEIAPPPSPAFRADVPAGIRDALALRPDYRQAILDLESRNITLAYTKNQTLPRFDLTGSLALLGFDGDYGTSLQRVGSRDQTAWSLGAIVSIPIPNRDARGAANAAKLECAKALVALQALEQQIIVDVDNASGQIVTSRQRIVSTTESTRLAQASLDAGQERLKAGTGTTFVVLELQKKLIEAEAAQLRARADYNKAVSEYQRQTGTALREHGVVLDDRGGRP
ncbi:MAG: TolC family protein [Chthoniobacter sp.]|nr:TolC family protein [Chthoniobacter sp.]